MLNTCWIRLRAHRHPRKRSSRVVQGIALHQPRQFLGEHEQVRAALALRLNFLQHIFTILKQHGRAAIVVPDNDSHLPSCSPFGLDSFAPALSPSRVSRPCRPLPRSPLSSSKAAPARPSAANYSSKPTFTPCCVCRLASFTPKAVRAGLGLKANVLLTRSAPARSAFGLPVSFFAPSKFRSSTANPTGS